MPSELICPTHGPYPAALGSCPYCKSSGGRPQPPSPLDQEDNLPTDLGYPGQGRAPRRDGPDDEAPTEIPAGRRSSGRRILDLDEEESTHLGSKKDLDETEVEFNRDAGVQAILWIKDGPRRGRIYKLTHDCVIGRKGTDIVLDDPKVSRTHAKVVFEKDHYVIVDFRSENGTYVNNERIRAEVVLKENDVIKIGDSIFVLKVLEL